MKRLDATESDVETRISLINKVKYANPTCKYCSFNCICIFEKNIGLHVFRGGRGGFIFVQNLKNLSFVQRYVPLLYRYVTYR